MANSLLTAIPSEGHVHLVIGSNPLAAARCTRSLSVGATPILLAPATASLHYGLQIRIDKGQVIWKQKHFEDTDLLTLGRNEIGNVVDAVFVTLSTSDPICQEVSVLCHRNRIPLNVVDSPTLSTFTILSTHSDGPLQIGVTTSGRGCKLASRIRREITSLLPPNLGNACERLGQIRRRIWEEDYATGLALEAAELAEVDEDDGTGQRSSFNKLVLEEDRELAKGRRMRWLGQICEYWPLARLAAINDEDVEKVMMAYTTQVKKIDDESGKVEADVLDARLNMPHIILAGSGPGSPSLLTLATHRAIQTADVVLADKLVPAPVLDLIPRRTPVHIARKFPGNAEAAQEELLTLGLEALKKGLCVLRLKQGDPYIYGRGGEEFLFFRKEGFTPTVLPGITSALSAPLFSQIPCTQRAVSDQILICTGTGRKGAALDPPVYNASQTVVFLMSLHRLGSLVESLVCSNSDSGKKPWPANTPCAVIERASCPDQRVVRSTLAHICTAIEEEGSRPPGLLVLGWSCEVLKKLDGRQWLVEEGFKDVDGLRLNNGSGAKVALADT
ncbi:MAG: hypothetical protein M1814_006709 [Vezdaea aestivalis]|nr:MAG: hypothetical protein M1814_006709 [Vezdaea aestivalis]